MDTFCTLDPKQDMAGESQHLQVIEKDKHRLIGA